MKAKNQSNSKSRSRNTVEIIDEEIDPKVARIIIAKEWDGNDKDVINVLNKFCKNWKGKKVDFIITCGGFLQFPWDKKITKKQIGSAENQNPEIFEMLAKQGEKHLKKILEQNNFIEKLANISKFVTFGVDSGSGPRAPHVELIFLVDLEKKKYYHIGKFYPTSSPSQKQGLVRFTDLKSCFLKLGKEKVMLLGCHDLNAFNPRPGRKRTGPWRLKIKDEIQELTKSESPTIILQHPHSTITDATWRNGWGKIKKILSENNFWYASAGKYLDKDGKPTGKTLDRKKVLAKSKNTNSIDFVFS